MSEDASRYLGYNDIRQLQDVGQKAAMLCLKYEVSQRAAAEALKVSRGLVRRAVDAVNKGRPIGTNGRPRILSSDEEAKLIDIACKKADEHRALTASQLTIENRALDEASNDPMAELPTIEAGVKTVSPSWGKRFIKRSEELKLVKPRLIEPERSLGCRKTVIEKWFMDIEDLFKMEHLHPSMIANFDETMVQPQAKSAVKVVGRSTSSAAVLCTEPDLPHITLGVTIFANGKYCKHLLIYPQKYVPQEVRGTNALEFIDYTLAGQDSGWITTGIFAEHCRKTIILAFLDNRARLGDLGVPNAPGILIVDGHSSRLNSKLLDELAELNISCPVLPSHASHVLQPLDLKVFGAFKSALSKGDSTLRKLTLPERGASLLAKVRKSLHIPLDVATVQASFRASGLFPFNPSIPLTHPCILLREDNMPSMIDQSGKGNGGRYLMSGKIITDLAEREAIRLVEEKTAQRKRAKLTENSTPFDSDVRIIAESGEYMVTPPGKRRGRPPKNRNLQALTDFLPEA